MGTIASEFKGLPMSDLISAPLIAACDAQLRLANATANFIEVIGFNPPTADDLAEIPPVTLGTTRTVSFTFTRPTPAQAADTTVTPATEAIAAGTETVQLDVPLLACVNIPALCIKNVNIVFDMEVKEATSSKSAKDEDISGSLDVSAKWGVVKAKLHVQGSVSSHQENTRTTDNSAKYHFELNASDSGMPEGLHRVLDILNSAIVPVVVE